MARTIDITNKRFGKLTALEPTNKRDSSNGIIWLCKCDCGVITEARGKKLRNGTTVSCGCESKVGRKPIERIGEKYGLLTVLEKCEKRADDGGLQYICVCECGNEIVVKSKSLGHSKFSCGCAGTSMGEHKIQKLLVENNISFAREYIFSDFRTDRGGTPRFDFAIFDDDNKLSHLIEFDGRQHFQQDTPWNGYSLEDTKRRDAQKNQYCLDNNIRLIRIRYDEKITLEKLI